LDLLGFIRPYRDFSMGYGEKNKKNSRLLSSRRRVSRAARVKSGDRDNL
jgi:hypothetical protein